MRDGPEKQALLSMTGFAATQAALDGWSWSADIRAVNGRSLDLRLRVPDVEGLEPALRKLCQARLARGNVTVNVKLAREEGAAVARVNPERLNEALELVREVETAAEAAGVTLQSLSASDIAAMRGVVEVSEAAEGKGGAELKAALMASLTECMDDFIADRAREGAALHAVLSERIDRVEALARKAAEAAGDRDEAARSAMERGLARLMEAQEMPDEARLLQELALLAVKTDVSEELDRLAAHVDAARALLAEEGAVGRKLDFLMQEFNREANTLCSKAQSSALTGIGLDLKAVIDQMREQVQNIE